MNYSTTTNIFFQNNTLMHHNLYYVIFFKNDGLPTKSVPVNTGLVQVLLYTIFHAKMARGLIFESTAISLEIIVSPGLSFGS